MQLHGNNPIQAAGDYDVELRPGQEYLVTVKGTWNGATIAIHNDNGPAGVFYPCDGGDLADGVRTEADISPSTPNVRFVVTGTSCDLQVTIVGRVRP